MLYCSIVIYSWVRSQWDFIVRYQVVILCFAIAITVYPLFSGGTKFFELPKLKMCIKWKDLLEETYNSQQNMKFANFFCHVNLLLHSTTIHHGGILSFLYNLLFCVLQFNVPLIYNSIMGLQHSMKIKTLLLSNALMS